MFVDSFESLVVIILSEVEGVLGGYSDTIVTTDRISLLSRRVPVGDWDTLEQIKRCVCVVSASFICNV